MNVKDITYNIINNISPISQNSFDAVFNIISIKKIARSEEFIKVNHQNTSEYLLLDGICKSFILNTEGDEVTLSFFLPESVLTPYTIRTKDNRSNQSFKAISDSTLAVFDAFEFVNLIRNNSDIRDFANTVLRNELFMKMNKELGLASLSAKDRLNNLRQIYPNIENLVPHNDIATYLGITNVSLSRLRSTKS